MFTKATEGVTPEKASEGTTDYINKVMPQFPGKKALVVPGCAFFGAIVTLMAEAGFERALTVEDADVIVFGGGGDISPELYGEKILSTTHVDFDQDIVEEEMYRKCVRLNKPMFGICRGAQLLHAMNQGTLWQDVNNHGGRDHYIVDIETDQRVLATSIHHQMLKVNSRMTLIAVTEEQIATSFKDGCHSMQLGENSHEIEVEAGAYPESKCFFVQGHPEVGDAEYRSWCMNKLFNFLQDLEPFQTTPEMELLDGVIG